MISVIVTTYNQEKTIGRTLNGILMQQCHEPVEIVIGEDCSTDGTLKVCQEYAEKYPDRILLLANKQNKGIVDNYFDCIFAAHGEYIADCAGDDFWIDEHKLEKELCLMEKHPDVGIVHTGWQYYETPSQPPRRGRGSSCKSEDKLQHSIDGIIRKSGPNKYGEEITDGSKMLSDILTQTTRPVIHLCTSLYRTDWIRRAHNENIDLFRNKEYGCEDLQVAYFMAKMGKVGYIDDITLNYSWGGESISNSVNHERLFHFYHHAGELTYDIARKEGMLNDQVMAFLQFRIYELMMHALRSGKKNLRQQALDTMQRWGVKNSCRIAITKLLTSNRTVWRGVLEFRTILKAIVLRCKSIAFAR